MSEQTNPTSENEDLLAEATAAMKEIQGEAEEVVADAAETAAEAVTAVADAVEAAVTSDDDDDEGYDDADVPSAVDEDDDDGEDDGDDDGEDVFEYEEVAVDGPTIYAPQEVRGRARRIGNDIRIEDINYKNVALLTRFLDARGRILSRRKTRVSAKVQRQVAREIKRARHLALLPYTAEHIRVTRKTRRTSRQR